MGIFYSLQRRWIKTCLGLSCRDADFGGWAWGPGTGLFPVDFSPHCKPLVSFRLHSLSKACLWDWKPEAKMVLLQMWGPSGVTCSSPRLAGSASKGAVGWKDKAGCLVLVLAGGCPQGWTGKMGALGPSGASPELGDGGHGKAFAVRGFSGCLFALMWASLEKRLGGKCWNFK